MKNEKGIIMVAVMLLTAMMAGFAITYISTAIQQQESVDSSIDDQDYYQSALSGFDIARAYLLNKYTANTTGWDTELGNSVVNSSTYYANSTSLPGGNINYTSGYTSWFQWYRNIDYHDNTYFAKIENNNDGGGIINDTDGVLKLTVYGWGGGNATSQRSQEVQLEGMVSYRTEPYQPTSALVVGGSLKVYGNASIGGTNGSIQANGAVTLTGSATVAGDVTSTGGITAPPGSIGGTTNANSPETNIPSINPSEYSSLATHIFKDNGLVYDQNDNLLPTPTGWSYNAGSETWSKSANVVNNGVYYFDDSNVEIGGSAGSASNPMTLTVMATGYINVTGSPSIAPSPLGGGIALMAGKDLRMRGAGGNVYGTGLYAAHEQISLVGTPTVNGSVLAEDYEDVCSLVTTSSDVEVQIGGTTSITYNGDLTTVLRDGNPYIKILGFKKTIKARY